LFRYRGRSVTAGGTLQARKNGRPSRKEAALKKRLLLPHEEQELINWIGSMQRRGFPPFLINVEEMAYALRLRRGLTRPIGQKWLYRFLRDNPDVKSQKS
jgi:hypothetical protein